MRPTACSSQTPTGVVLGPIWDAIGTLGRSCRVQALAYAHSFSATTKPGWRTRPDDDRALIRAARGGSQEDAGRLFERYWVQAWKAAFAITRRRSLADDVAQDAFERAFRALDRFDERRPFGPWLHRIVVNRALDALRSEQRLVSIEAVPDIATTDVDDAGAEACDALRHLSPERRAVVVLRHLLGYTPPEIAQILDLPVGTVNSRLGRALDDLRGALEHHDG